MGFDTDLIISSIDDELKCPICYRLLEDPVQGVNCDHVFCRLCINSWLNSSNKCPIDREQLFKHHLTSAPKILVNLINRLEAKCSNSAHGCNVTLPLGLLCEHLKWCYFRSVNEKPQSVNLESEFEKDANNRKSSEFDQNQNTIPNDLKMLRQMCDLSGDLKQINEQIDLIKFKMNENKVRSKLINETIGDHKLNVTCCTEKIRKLRQPLKKLLLRQYNLDEDEEEDEFDTVVKDDCGVCEKESDTKLDCNKRKWTTINVKNLSSFITIDILREYLRQNDVECESIVEEKLISADCKDFLIKIKSKDRLKIVTAQLWPRGVIVTELETSSVLIGACLSNEYPTLRIQPGLSYWRF